MHAAASALCRWAWERGFLRRNPMDNLRKLPAPPPRPPAILAPDGVEAVLRAAREHAPRMVPYFAVGFFAGLRPVRELAGLVWEDIDLADRRIYVPAGRAKTGRCRPVPVSANLARWLETVPRDLRRGPVAPYSRSAFRRVVAASGVGWRADVMRHTRVSYRLALTGDEAAVAAEGGHSIGIMRRHYANLRIPAADVAAFWSIVPDGIR
jgi:integrase